MFLKELCALQFWRLSLKVLFLLLLLSIYKIRKRAMDINPQGTAPITDSLKNY